MVNGERRKSTKIGEMEWEQQNMNRLSFWGKVGRYGEEMGRRKLGKWGRGVPPPFISP